MRRFVWGLVALNLLLLLWNGLRVDLHSPPAVSPVPDADGSLILLSELQYSPVSRQPERCLRVGPFVTAEAAGLWQDMAGVLGLSEVQVVAANVRSLSRVMLLGSETAEQALDQLSELRASMASASLQLDHYLVTSGEWANQISLGLFSDHSNAERIQAQLAALGHDVEIFTETRQVSVYWISMPHALVDEETREKVRLIVAEQEGLGNIENLCETIALPDDFP